MATTGTQTQTGIMDPYLQKYWDQAQAGYNNNSGTWNAPYTGQTVTPMSGQTKDALWDIQQLGYKPNAINNKAMGFASGLLGSGGNINTEGDLRSLLGNSTNDAYGGVVDTQAGKLTDDINRQFSASGRYGSAAHSGTVADQVGDFRSNAIANNWNANIQNQAGILGQISNNQNMNAQQGLAAASLSPTLYGQQYAPYDRLASVGSAYDDLATRQLQANSNLWDGQQNQSLKNLQAYGGLLGAAGSSGGSSTTVSQPTNYASMIGSVGTAASGISGLLGSLFSGGGSGATGLLY
jgi:hypothetical protein